MKYYYKKNKKKKNIQAEKKLTYDDLVNVRQDVSEIKISNSDSSINNISIVKYVCISLVIFAIIIGSLIVFHYI